ncbi:MAG: Eco47II family restriction endonuclease, partial [Bacilli bacterium]|nr:Eco47II family restriction endonuclease [Bacilli bacterium]
MMWNIKFISKEDFKKHVSNTIKTYDNTLKGINLKAFNSNIIDPIKLTFDSKVYKKTIEEVIENEIARQRDKTNTNAIGYFHQNMFKYIEGCEVPDVGFDVIYTRPDNSKVYV